MEIKTFEKSVLISRLVLRLPGFQSWYWDRYQDFKDCSLDIETGIEALRIAVFISRLVLRLSGLQSGYWDWYQEFEDCSLDIMTGIKTLRIAVLKSRLISIKMCLETVKTYSYLWPLLRHIFSFSFLYWDWYQDFKNSKPVNNTGMKIMKIPILG